MADVVGVVFQNGTKTYYFDPAGLELSRGDRVVVQTMKGVEIGQVAEPPHDVDDSEIPAQLKKVIRVATDEDLEIQEETEVTRKEAMATCRELIARHGLDMKLVGADVGFGGEKIIFNFYSDERVDFRALVADLAKTLKMRIELRQVGAREEARMIGGLGPCGRNLCCTLFPGDEEPVSIRMAKEQNLPLNPMKISGLCGRLMCCLKYEQEQYVCFRKEAPAKGTSVSTSTGEGVIVGYNSPKDAITVRFGDGSYTDIRLKDCQLQEGGGLLVVPEEVEELPFVPLVEDTSGLEALVAADVTPDALAVVEAEVITGENGESVEVIVAESSRPGRGRRGRGRRGGKRRTQVPASNETTDGDEGETSTTKSGDVSSEGKGCSQRRSSHSNRRPGHKTDQRSEKRHDETSGSSGEDKGAQKDGGVSRARRRRRPRRPGGAAENGANGNRDSVANPGEHGKHGRGHDRGAAGGE